MAVAARMIVLDGDLPVGEIQEPPKEDHVLGKSDKPFSIYAPLTVAKGSVYGSSWAWPAYSTTIHYGTEVVPICYGTVTDNTGD